MSLPLVTMGIMMMMVMMMCQASMFSFVPWCEKCHTFYIAATVCGIFLLWCVNKSYNHGYLMDHFMLLSASWVIRAIWWEIHRSVWKFDTEEAVHDCTFRDFCLDFKAKQIIITSCLQIRWFGCSIYSLEIPLYCWLFPNDFPVILFFQNYGKCLIGTLFIEIISTRAILSKLYTLNTIDHFELLQKPLNFPQCCPDSPWYKSMNWSI